MLEFCAYKIESNRLIREGYTFGGDGKPPYPKKMETFTQHYLKEMRYDVLSNVAGIKNKKRPVIIFGDVLVNNTEADFTNMLSEQTKRPVYNFAKEGWTVAHMHYLLKTEELTSTVKNPSSVVFVFTPNQFTRMQAFAYYPQNTYLSLKYKDYEGILMEQTPKAFFLYHSYFIRAMERTVGLNNVKSKNSYQLLKAYNLMQLLFEESKRIAEVRYHNVENFIIVRYVPTWRNMDELKKYWNSMEARIEYDFWRRLQDIGYKIIEVEEIYWDPQSPPLEKASKVISEAISQEIK